MSMPRGPGAVLPLVGRQPELEALRARLEEMLAGRGSAAMLAGEAGIGKTALAQAFAAEAAERGAAVLWGSCPEGEWAPPFGPWVEALAALARPADPRRLAQDLGPDLPALARLLPALRAIFPGLPAPAPLGAEEERFRLFDAVARWLQAAGQEPLVLALDDLHWADRDSLNLLRHVARLAPGARLLVLGTYRDPDPDLGPRHPLLQVLAALRRESDYLHLRLRGFSVEEAAEYLARAAGQELPQALVRAVYEETGGNPFYIREVLRHLLEESKLVRQGGRWEVDFSLRGPGIPEGIRQVLARRLARLSDATNRVLRSAAGFSGGFQLAVLREVADLPEEPLLDCLDEALGAGLLRVVGEAPPTYDFAHAIVRHTLYDALNPDRRARLHRRIALGLEQVHADRRQEYAAELAAQYHASAALPGAEAGIPHALAAAEQARAAYAYERAASFLGVARGLAASAAPELRAEILARLAIAEAEALMLEAAQETARQALAQLEEVGLAPVRRVGFLESIARALKQGGAPRHAWEPLVRRGLALVGEPPFPSGASPAAAARSTPEPPPSAVLWARLTLLLDRFDTILTTPLLVHRWLGHDPRAVEILRTSGDEEDYARTLEPTEWSTREETSATLALARTWRRPAAAMRALAVAANDLALRHADFREAAVVLQDLLAAAERCGSVAGQAESLAQMAVLFAGLGRFPEARVAAQRTHQVLARLGPEHPLQSWSLWLDFVLALYLDGDWPTIAAQAGRVLEDWPERLGSVGLAVAALAALAHARAGEWREAGRRLDALTPALQRTPSTLYGHNAAVGLASSCVWETAAVERAAAYQQLALALIAAGVGATPLGSHTLAVARMAALRGEADAAIVWFARARAELEASGQQPLRALADHDEALARLRGGHPPAGVARLLEAAAARFHALGMEGWAARAEAACQRFGPAALPPARPLPCGLTPREAEVLQLIARGRSTAEIAADLVVSRATVERHITHIYDKIGARGRAAATAFALRHGLADGG